MSNDSIETVQKLLEKKTLVQSTFSVLFNETCVCVEIANVLPEVGQISN